MHITACTAFKDVVAVAAGQDVILIIADQFRRACSGGGQVDGGEAVQDDDGGHIVWQVDGQAFQGRRDGFGCA